MERGTGSLERGEWRVRSSVCTLWCVPYTLCCVHRQMAKLSATLCGGRLALPLRPLAYRLTCVNGKQYLLGTADPPFPLTTQEEKRPGNAAETSAVALVVSFQSVVPMMKILS